MLSALRLGFVLPVAVWLMRGVYVPSIDALPVVNLGYAQYQGVPNIKGNIDFLGIRYAAPPAGQNRFREPQPPAKVNGVQLANSQPNRCVQAPLGMSPVSSFRGNSTLNVTLGTPGRVPPLAGVPPVSEDCLFLNVVVPGTKMTSAARLPVVVWIHGGGYVMGSISYPGPYLPTTTFFDGNDLVQRSDGKAVVVLLQYRLGLYGFLSGEDVKQNGALNAGLLDQQFALTWIQRHIHKFGGDPEKVAVWGESAGAGSVLQHLTANGGNTMPPLLSTAILSSVYLPPQYQYDAPIPEAVYKEVIRLAGCDTANEQFHCLQAVDASVLEHINFAVSSSVFSMTLAFGPVVDGSLIRSRPLNSLQRGKLNAKNVLTVRNTREGAILVNPALAERLGAAEYIGDAFPTLSEDKLNTFSVLYSGLGDAFEQADHFLGEALFICPTYSVLRSLKGLGYKGHFALPPAFHADDIGYYFPSTTPTGAPPYNDTTFINTFAGSLLDFAINQTPLTNRPGSLLSEWPKWSEGNQMELVFNRTGGIPAISMGTTSSELYQRCQFWDSIGPFIGQ